MIGSAVQNDKSLSEVEFLFSELEASEKAYASFIQADIYPHKRPYFEKSYRQRTAFTAILRDEFETIGYSTSAPSKNPAHTIFEPMEHQVLEDNLGEAKLDSLIVEKEEELLLLYQKVLARDLPNVTLAILQSQAGQLNNNLQELRTDLLKTGKRDQATTRTINP